MLWLLRESLLRKALSLAAESLGAEPKTFAGQVHEALLERRLALWRKQISEKINWELFDRGVEAFDWATLEIRQERQEQEAAGRRHTRQRVRPVTHGS